MDSEIAAGDKSNAVLLDYKKNEYLTAKKPEQPVAT